MALENGKYMMYSKADDDPVSRKLAETKDLGPKGVYKLPKAQVTPALSDLCQWDVEKLENGNYTLRNRGWLVGAGSDGSVRAFFYPAEAVATEWSLKSPELAQGEDTHLVIKFANGPDGWLVKDKGADEQYPRIAVGPLDDDYPANQVFVFKKVE